MYNLSPLRSVSEGPEGFVMATVNLSRMTVEELMDLRERVDGLLSERRAELERGL